jgi:hypothetical protein
MKTLWLTDPHLEFLEAEGLDRFYSKMEKASADAVLISGDIGQATNTNTAKQEKSFGAGTTL